ncbi:atmA protein [Cordyceps javanica]|uniref:AtmA protein n=1 Tax=Cordyceps javanica TaxID=43265 RepID=A0A545VJQ9_9HYPO|nr:atmA protein [Cordyceps javanica]TQW01964.1 atmA protein [Cordyceps javanica]
MAGKILAPLGLLGLLLAVPYFVGYLSFANGLLPLVDDIWAAGRFPDGTPLRTRWLGGPPKLDELLSKLVVFFWPVAAFQHPGLFLHSLAFSGTFAAGWTLVTLETWRAGNAWTLSGFSVHLGLLAQVLTFAFATPVYGLLHLLTGRTASAPSRASMHIPYAVLAAFPLVFFVGNTVPSVAMVLPFSAHNTVAVKQLLTALWQPWPAYTAFGLSAAHLVLGSSGLGLLTAGDRPTPEGRGRAAAALRLIYAIAFGNAAVSHLAAATVTLGTVLAPKIFHPDYAVSLHPLKVLETVLPWAPNPVAQIRALGDGVNIFLRWDYLLGSTSLLLWASVLHLRARAYYHKTAAAAAAAGSVPALPFLAKVAALYAVVGPAAAAVELMWEREELVLQSDDKTPTTTKKKN